MKIRNSGQSMEWSDRFCYRSSTRRFILVRYFLRTCHNQWSQSMIMTINPAPKHLLDCLTGTHCRPAWSWLLFLVKTLPPTSTLRTGALRKSSSRNFLEALSREERSCELVADYANMLWKHSMFNIVFPNDRSLRGKACETRLKHTGRLVWPRLWKRGFSGSALVV